MISNKGGIYEKEGGDMKTDQTTAEEKRLKEARDRNIPRKKWGPYLSERQWGTVHEDYSEGGGVSNEGGRRRRLDKVYSSANSPIGFLAGQILISTIRGSRI